MPTPIPFTHCPLLTPLQDIPGGHPYMLSLGILGGIYAFENPLQGCLLVRRYGARVTCLPCLWAVLLPAAVLAA